MGKIKTITKLVALVDDHEQEPEHWTKRSYVEMDERGNTTLEAIYREDGSIETKTVQVFDEQNRIIESISYLSEDEIGEHSKYELNNENKIVSETIEYSDGSRSFKEFIREDDTITANIIDEDGDFEGREVRIFDEKGMLVEEITYDYNEEIEERSLFQYDDNSNMIERLEYGRDKSFVSRRHFKYDEHNNPVEIIATTEKGEIISHRILQYDAHQNIIEQQIDGFVIKNYFDENNLQQKEETYGPNGNIEAFKEYFYDENNTLTSTLSYHTGEQYSMEPGVFTRTASSYIKSIFKYSYYNE